MRTFAILMLVAGLAQAETNLDARALLERVVANRAMKDFALKGRLSANRDQSVIIEVLVKNTPAETRTIYRAATNEVLIVQPVRGETRYFLGGAKRTARLLGSEFTYYDLGLPFLHWPDPKYVGEDRVRGRDCQVVEVRAASEPYSRVKMWIDQEYFALLRAEAFDADDGLVKRFAISSFKRIGEVWIPRGVEAATVLSHQALPAEEKSRLEIYEGNYDARLPAEWFAEERFGGAR